ncbi:MAG: CvpA family protein [Acidimicrobiia bacterium]|nr:CvpA family protein [Acidimicrobiia bacterium]
MIDLALGATLAILGLYGWAVGLVRALVSLAVIVVGTVVSFRLSEPLGEVVADMSGTSPDASRMVAGFGVLMLISLAAAIAVRILHLGIRFLPGVSTLNRAAGAALTLAGAALVITILLSLATIAPLPEAFAEELEGSVVAETLTEPDGMPQQVLAMMSGDRVVELTLRIRELTGDRSAVASSSTPVMVPPAAAADLNRLPVAEEDMFGLLNEERVAQEAAPLARSSGLDQVAFELAMEGYGSGTILPDDQEELRARLNRAGIPTIARAEVAVLAASPEAGHAALVDRVPSVLGNTEFNKVGIVVVEGPVGLLIIGILAG